MTIEVDISGFGHLKLEYLVLDLNGTIANAGDVPKDLFTIVNKLKQKLNVYIVSADTFGTASEVAKAMGVSLHTLKSGKGSKTNEKWQKAKFVKRLGRNSVVALGNGRNDELMIKTARLGIAIIGAEGCVIETLNGADVVFTNASEALKTLFDLQALRATLRS